MSRRVAAVLALLMSFAGMASASAQTPEAAFSTVEAVPVPTSQSLLALSFPDALHGYAVGGFGTIVATKDGGKTWVQQKSTVEEEPRPEEGAATSTLSGVSFTDSLHGWAVGGIDLIINTTDGGATWVRRPVPPINDHQAPRSINDDFVGQHWTFMDVQFTSTDSGHLVGAGGAVFATSDGGASWTWQGDARFGRVRRVDFTDEAHGQAVGEARPQSFVTIATTDGGTHWSIDHGRDVGPQIAGTNFQAVSFVDSKRGYIASDSGRIFATIDGGRNWSVQRKDTTETFEGIAFADGQRGAAVGYVDIGDGRRAAIVTTGDGGETWVARPLPGAILWDVAFADPTTAFAVGCEVFTTTCQKSMIVRITFPSAPHQGSGGGGFAVPLPFLIVGAVLVAGLGWILVVRRRPMHERH